MSRGLAVAFAVLAACACGAAPREEAVGPHTSVPTRPDAHPDPAAAARREAPLPTRCERAEAKLTLAARLTTEGFSARSNRLLAQAGELCPAKRSAAESLVAKNRASTQAAASGVGKSADELWAASQAARAAGDMARARRLASLAALRFRDQGTQLATWTGIANLGSLAVSHDGSLLLSRDYVHDALVVIDAKQLEPKVFLDLEKRRDDAERYYRDHGRAQFSPNGKRVAVADRGDVVLYDTVSGARGRRLTWADQSIQSFQFAPDSASVATLSDAGSDAVVRRFDVQSGDSIAEYRIAKARSAGALALSPTGAFIAVATPAGIELLDGRTLAKRKTLGKADGASTNALAFSPTGHRLASISGGTALEIWDTATGKLVTQAAVDRPWRSSILGFSPDGSRVRVSGGTWGDALMELDTASGKALASKQLPRGDFLLSAGGTVVAIGESRGGLYIVDAATGKVLAEAVRHTERLETLAVSEGHLALARRVREPDGIEIVALGVRPHDPRFITTPGYKAVLALSPAGERLAGSFGGKELSAWDLGSGKPIALPSAPDWVYALAFAGPDAIRGAAGPSEKQLFSARFGDEACRLLDPMGRADILALTGGRAVLGTQSGTLLVDFRTEQLAAISVEKDTRALALSGDSRVLVAATSRGLERIALPNGDKTLLSGQCKGGPVSVSDDGSSVFARCSHRELALFSRSGTVTEALEGENLALSPSGRMPVTALNGRVSIRGLDLKELVSVEFGAARGVVIARGPNGELEILGGAPAPADRFYCRAGTRAAPFELCEDVLYRDDLVRDALAAGPD